MSPDHAFAAVSGLSRLRVSSETPISTRKPSGMVTMAGWLNGTVNMVLLTTVLLVLLAFNGKGGGGGLPSPGQVRGLPWWTFLAGAIGATIVVTQLSAAPSLGAGLLVALFVAGTAAGSVVCDRFGLVGYERVSIPWDRILGLCLVVAGVILVARPWAEGR